MTDSAPPTPAADSPLSLFIDGLHFGEGPRWHDGCLWYSDFFQHSVYTVTPDGTRATVLTIEDQPSGLGWMPNGDLLLVAMDTHQVRRWDGTTLSVHADLSSIATGPCNDMIVATDGTAYVGNFGFDLHGGAQLVPAVLTGVQPDGDVWVAAEDLLFPNGSVITPDGSTLIVGETFGSRYTAWDIAADGRLNNRREWAAIERSAPDGCALDADGAIWFSDPRNSEIVRVVEGGDVTHRVPTPQPTFACALGGADGRTLYVLTASEAGARGEGSGDGAIWQMTVDVPASG